MAKTVIKAHVVSPVLLVRTDKMVAMAKMAKMVIKAHVVSPALLVRTDVTAKTAKMVPKALAV